MSIAAHRSSVTEPFSHVGVIVGDLQAAVARFGETLGLAFTAPVVREPRMLDRGGADVSAPFRLAYGLDGPPHIELIEMQGEGFYGPQNAEGLHHVGIWVDDIDAAVAELSACGVEPEVVLSRRVSGGVTAVYFAPGALHGTRVEYVDGSLRDGFLAQLTDPTGIR